MFFDHHTKIAFLLIVRGIEEQKEESDTQFQRCSITTEENIKLKRLWQHGFNGMEFCNKF